MKGSGVATAPASKNRKPKKPVNLAEETDAGAPEYEVVEGRTVWITRDRKGRPCDVPIANFEAKIVRAVVVDDGADESRHFDIDVAVGGETFFVRDLPAAEFASLEWVIPRTNGRGRIVPDRTARVRDAIQFLSGQIPAEEHFGHLGWRRVGQQWCYLHAAGAIGPNGSLPGVSVAVGDKFARFVLPDPDAVDDGEIKAAVRDSLRFLTVAPARITAPLLCAVWRAPLGPADFSLHVVGPTGAGKTVLSSLAQQHWGAGLDWQHCPASWSSTANANEGLRFIAKDTLLVVDDLAPGAASPRDIDRTFRGQGNASGRDRMKADSSLRKPKYPRGLLVSTGEDSPLIQSATARTLVLAVAPDAVKWSRVTARQQDADKGLYALAFAAYVRWLAGRYEETTAARPKRVAELRAQLLADNVEVHKRTPGISAELTFAMEQFLAFSLGIKAIDHERAEELRGVIATGLSEAAAAQNSLQRSADPVARFRALLTGALTAGHAHVVTAKGGMPLSSGAWGWRRSEPSGDLIGWVDDGDLYLDKEATYGVLARMARDASDLLLKPDTLWTRLHERGLLSTTDLNTKRKTLAVRRVLEGARRQVLHLRTTIVLGDKDESSDGVGSDDDE